MNTFVKKMTLYLPLELASKVETVRKEKFSSESQSEMFQELIRLGLDSSKQTTNPQNRYK